MKPRRCFTSFATGIALFVVSVSAFAYEVPESRIGKTYWIGKADSNLLGREAVVVPKNYVTLKYGTALKPTKIIKDVQYGMEEIYHVTLQSGETGYITVRMFAAAQTGGFILSYDPKKRDEERVAAAKNREQERMAAVRNKKWPTGIEEAVINKKVLLGMTDEQVQMAWGKPRSINRSVGAWGVHEQWMYGSTYLYFENGKLKSWQESR